MSEDKKVEHVKAASAMLELTKNHKAREKKSDW